MSEPVSLTIITKNLMPEERQGALKCANSVSWAPKITAIFAGIPLLFQTQLRTKVNQSRFRLILLSSMYLPISGHVCRGEGMSFVMVQGVRAMASYWVAAKLPRFHLDLPARQPHEKNPHCQDPLAFEISAKSLDLRLKAPIG